MALTAQEQAILDSLTAKASEPAPVSPFNSVETILHELVRVSDKFSANPTVREDMLSFLEGLISPTPAPVE